MTKATISIATALACLLLPGCVAGGSGVKLEAKKNAEAIDLKIRYYAFGGADLKRLTTCMVQYGSEPSLRSAEFVTREKSKSTAFVEWIASTPHPEGAQELLPLRLTFMTEDLIGRNTTTHWVVNPRSLTSSYQPVHP